MKSTLKHIKAVRLLMALTAAIFSMGFAACSDKDSDDISLVTDAQISFTYTVPDELLRYVDITVCHNNDAGDEAEWYPMLENTYTVNYNIKDFPMTAPVIFVFDGSNRLVSGINVDWTLTMDIAATLTVNGKKETWTHTETYPIKGDLSTAIYELQNNPIMRTYVVNITNDGSISFAR